MSWEEDLVEASLDGIGFPMGKREVTYGRDGARITLPYVAGQAVEDTGRKARVFKFEVPCFPGIEGYEDLYPGTYRRLLALAEDDRQLAEVEYIDPVHGAMDVKVWTVSEVTDPDVRDGAMLSFELEEVTIDITGVIVRPRTSPERDGTEAARASDDSIANSSEINDTDVNDAIKKSGFPKTSGESWTSNATMESLWLNFQAATTFAALAVDQAQYEVDRARYRVSAVVNLPLMGQPQNWALAANLYQLLDAIGRFGDLRVARAIPVVGYQVGYPLSVYELAVLTYGDASRASEILRRNSIRTPYSIPVGTLLRLAVR